MGAGTWTSQAFADYSTVTGKSVSITSTGHTVLDLDDIKTRQNLYTRHSLDPALDPKGVVRECCDSEEHPNTIPVILALDVTGSMGEAANQVAAKLSEIMETLYDKVQDVEFMIQAVGDLDYDDCPMQISQFESDVRIASQLDKVYFEGGGGGNDFESYTFPWYMGTRHCELDCWDRGKKGIIITMGDEPLNPYLPCRELNAVTGDYVQADIETKDLYKEASAKYDIYHIYVEHGSWTRQPSYVEKVSKSFKKYLDDNHFRVSNVDSISKEISDIIINATSAPKVDTPAKDENGMISW